MPFLSAVSQLSNNQDFADLELPISLLSGSLVFFSPASVQWIEDGYDFFTNCYSKASQVVALINDGLIGAVDFGNQGTFWLSPMPKSGLSDVELSEQQFCFEMGLAVMGGRVCFRDLYDLYQWESDLSGAQSFELADGFYKVTLATTVSPELGPGAEQRVLFIYEQMAAMPFFEWQGIPRLYDNKR
jgi:hypothetical protein